ncbi:hypothetical protein VNI00_007002 [Paramarasmius palmivorus]|uniref:Uncharacterized protein n=1 Tax=Paramarasmius palmivorus TaxID=297713 RepID=A0AAW0D4G0_9AGAR
MAADTQELSDRKRKKSGASKTQAAAANASERAITDTAGYETDATSSGKTRAKLKKKSKARKGSGDAGYETDDGYVSSTPTLSKSKSRSRFFKLGNRSKTHVDDEENRAAEEVPPPLPPLPVFRLPIAERFATTLGDVNKGATAEPPLGPPPSLPFGSSINSPLSTPSSSSVTTPKELDLLDGQASFLSDLASKHNHSPFTSVQQKGVVRSRDSGSTDSHGHSGSNTLFSKLNFPSFDSFTSSNNSPVRTKSPVVTFPTTRSPSPPTASKLKQPVISYPITRSPSPPPSPPTIQVIPNPSPNKGATKHVPRPLFLHRVPSDQEKTLNPQMDRSPLPKDWSPAGSPFVVLTPNPTPSPTGLDPRRPGAQKLSSLDTVTQPSRLRIPSPVTPSRDQSPARSPVVPSVDYIVPSPRPGTDDLHFTPPTIHYSSHSELPPATPPPTSPLPDVPSTDGNDSQGGSYFASQQRGRPELVNSNSNLTVNSTPQRGRESPFPSRPILPSPHRSQAGTGYAGFETRVKVKRYRDLYGWRGGDEDDDRGTSPIPDIYMQSTSSREPNFKRHRPRQSTKVGIKVEEPSDDEGYGGEDGGDSDYYDEEEMNYVVNGMFGDKSVSDLGHYGGEERETEAALSRSHSYEALRDRYNDPRNAVTLAVARGRGGRGIPASPISTPTDEGTSSSNWRRRPRSPNVQRKVSFDIDESESDDKSRYPDDERTTVYSTLGADLSRRGSWESGSRASFMDNEKSQRTRERFLRRVDMMYDESGRERPATRGVGRGAVAAVPPVPRLPQGASSKVWI